MALFRSAASQQDSELYTAIDIGDSKICCAIAKAKGTTEKQNNDERFPTFRVLGIGQHLSRGMKNGIITDMENLEDSILSAVHTAEVIAGKTISRVYLNLSGAALRTETITSEINVSGRPIDDVHIQKILNQCHQEATAADFYVVHAIPQSYTVDNVKGIKDPRGMSGATLQTRITLILASSTLVQNIVNCVGRCQLDIDGIVASPYASGLASLVPDELELGATLIDMGGGVTTFASFIGGSLVAMGSVPLGGNHITNDISRVLSTPVAQAERLKNLYGTLLPGGENDRESINIPQLGELFKTNNQSVSKNILTDIIRARVEEILKLLKQRMQASGVDPVAFQQIIITGGTSQLSGFRELASEVFKAPVRQSLPMHMQGVGEIISTPMFSTCAGLLLYGFQDRSGFLKNHRIEISGNLWHKISTWVRENF